ncbi:phosphatase PAP2 family protein [Chryseolinea soli]|nr:phosphatase PAP2 family protein [Chryseolinea soli]
MKFSSLLIAALCLSSGALAQIKPQPSEPAPDLQLQEDAPQAKKEYRLLHAVKVPALLIGLGVYSAKSDDVINRYEIREERNNIMPNFHSKVDNYLMHAPVAIVYGLNIAGVKGKNDFRNRTLLLVKSEMIMAALTFSFKSITHEERPDGKDEFSFPSGHTAQAFATATFMAKEYGDQSVWYTIGAYGMATTVGAMRIMNNRHWVSDVFAGAGIGILSTNIAYLTHRYHWKNKNSNLTVVPTYAKGPGLYIGYRFN